MWFLLEDKAILAFPGNNFLLSINVWTHALAAFLACFCASP